MTRLSSSALVFAALPLLLAVGCSSSDNKPGTSKSPATTSCDDGDNKVGDDCACDDDSASSYVCNDDTLSCDCPDDAPVSTKLDGGKKPATARDAGASPKADAKAPPVTSDDDAGNPGTGPVTMTPPAMTASDPVLPAMMGACPDFKTGTATIGGLANISLQVGPKSNGTGSLLFYWHGTAPSTAALEMAGYPAQIKSEILAGGGIIVAPQDSTKKGTDCSGTGTFYQGDFEIADLIVACAVANYGIDPHKIYATGCSAGGLHSGCMASLRSNYMAAVVTNSGGSVFPQKLESSHVPALMTMHGDGQDMVIVNFADTSKTIDTQFAGAGGFVIDCDHAGGHCGAPAALQIAGWKFMQDHPFGVAPEPYTSGIPTTFPSYCKVIPK